MSLPRPPLRWLLAFFLLGISHCSHHAMALNALLSWSRNAPEHIPLDAPSPPLPAAESVMRVDQQVATASAPATSFDAVIDSVAAELKLDARLLHAIIYVESRYNADALSSKGAMGLMQVLPGTGERFGYTDLRHPHTNVRAGAIYFKWLLNYFNHNLELAIAGYNAGEGAVKKFGRTIPPYPETQNYVHKVMERYRDDPKASPVFQASQPDWNNTVKSGYSSQNTLAPLNRLFELLLSSPPPVACKN
ncbi:soluble lytic murein transglycosylase [Pseudomonas chlororaphis]|uniref:lytic transglycosylase domain-containing protein n=1 Tax=Pseudomonas chlororaphis TaxID=587753 RepID=UPI0039E723E4